MNVRVQQLDKWVRSSTRTDNLVFGAAKHMLGEFFHDVNMPLHNIPMDITL